jgi:putative PIN family toxin of toxin-antitoxin system
MRWIVPQEQLDELSSTIVEPKFVEHITPQMWAAFQAEVEVSATVVPRLEHDVAPMTRDRIDDYLIAAAFEHDVDILVSGDKDLLILAEFLELPRIMSPAQFVAEFGES